MPAAAACYQATTKNQFLWLSNKPICSVRLLSFLNKGTINDHIYINGGVFTLVTENTNICRWAFFYDGTFFPLFSFFPFYFVAIAWCSGQAVSWFGLDATFLRYNFFSGFLLLRLLPVVVTVLFFYFRVSSHAYFHSYTEHSQLRLQNGLPFSFSLRNEAAFNR